MPGHNLQIDIKSGNQIEQITISDKAVDLLMPNTTPAEAVERLKTGLQDLLSTLVSVKQSELKAQFIEENITVSS